jgi:hypothetical protein
MTTSSSQWHQVQVNRADFDASTSPSGSDVANECLRSRVGQATPPDAFFGHDTQIIESDRIVRRNRRSPSV